MAVSKSLFLFFLSLCFASVKSGVFFVSFRRGVLTRFSIIGGFFSSVFGATKKEEIFCRCIQEQKRERERKDHVSRDDQSRRRRQRKRRRRRRRRRRGGKKRPSVLAASFCADSKSGIPTLCRDENVPKRSDWKQTSSQRWRI